MTKKIQRASAALISAGLLATALTSCASAASEPDDATAQAANGLDCSEIDLSAPPETPVQIRLGHGTAAEEQIYLMEAGVATASNEGKWYAAEYSTVKSSSDRLTALQAGQLEGASLSIQPIIVAAAKDVPISVVAAQANEDASEGFTSKFVSLEGSGIASLEDLKGKTIGIPDYGTASDYWAKTAVASAGLDPDRDVNYALVPLSSQYEALKNGTIDVANFVEPFYTMADQASPGELVTVFDSITGSEISPQPLQNVVFDNTFIEQNTGAVCAWLADFNATTEYYLANTEEAKQKLLDAKIVAVAPEVYLAADDWARPADGALDLEALDELIVSMKEFGVLEESLEVEAADMVYPGVSQTK